MRRVGVALACLIVLALDSAGAAAETLTYRKVRVEHGLEGDEYAKAIARIVDFAAERARKLDYDMPEEFHVSIVVDSSGPTRLSTTGDYQIHLQLQRESQLLRPAKSHINHVYGFCHEVGHCCQYRILKERAWMTTGAAEGWAHYYGSRMVELLVEKEGKNAWPDAYDYSERGLTRRLKTWKRSKNEVDRGGYLWHQLVEIVGEHGVANLFRAIQEAEIDSFDARKEVEAVLARHKKGRKLVKWWKEAAEHFVEKLEKSKFETETLSPKKLARKPKTLAQDSGEARPGGSWPGGSGAAVRFRVAEKGSYLTEVHVYGQRYGGKTEDDFYLWLLDAEFKPFRRVAVPYAEFDFGKPHWERFEVKPTLVPEVFHVCVVYNAESNKGIFRYHDGEAGGESFVGVPGESSRPYEKGDWLIRVVVDRKRK